MNKAPQVRTAIIYCKTSARHYHHDIEGLSVNVRDKHLWLQKNPYSQKRTEKKKPRQFEKLKSGKKSLQRLMTGKIPLKLRNRIKNLSSIKYLYKVWEMETVRKPDMRSGVWWTNVCLKNFRNNGKINSQKWFKILNQRTVKITDNMTVCTLYAACCYYNESYSWKISTATNKHINISFLKHKLHTITKVQPFMIKIEKSKLSYSWNIWVFHY